MRREVLATADRLGKPRQRRVGKHVLELCKSKHGDVLVAIRHPAGERHCLWDKALGLGTDYNDFEPGRVRFEASPQKPPPFLVGVGELEAVRYISDKFDGTKRHYHHSFKQRSRPILAVHPDGAPLYVVGGRYHVDDRGIVDD